MNDTAAEIARLEQLLADAKRLAGIRTTNTATININAGGWGVMVCCCLFAFTAGLCIPLYLTQRDHDRRIDDLSHYLQAIYQEAPKLRPKEN